MDALEDVLPIKHGDLFHDFSIAMAMLVYLEGGRFFAIFYPP